MFKRTTNARATAGRDDDGPGIAEMFFARSFLFDEDFYLKEVQASGADLRGLTACAHFLRFGEPAGLSPHPLFDVRFYGASYPDVVRSRGSLAVHYLMHGHVEDRNPHPFLDAAYLRGQLLDKTANPLLAYLRARPGSLKPHPEFDDHHVRSHLDPRTPIAGAMLEMKPVWRPAQGGWAGSPTMQAGLLSRLQGQIARAGALDPDILPPHCDLGVAERVFSKDAHPLSRRLFRRLRQDVGSDCDRIFFVPHIVPGGAEKVLVHFMRAILALSPSERLCIVTTDAGDADVPALDIAEANVRIVDISPQLRNVEERHACQTLAIFLQFSRAKHVYVLNSRLAWMTFDLFGRALKRHAELGAFVFCYEHDEFGRRAGYAWTHLGHTMPHLTRVFTDNRRSADLFVRDHRLGEAEAGKFVPLYQPAEAWMRRPDARAVARPVRRDARAPAVLWAGRFHRQKNLPLALAIAQELPDIDVLFAGGAADDPCVRDLPVPKNAAFIGPFDGFENLPVTPADVFLHTSDWDGLPNVLIEAGAAGLAVVARDVGGVSELIDDRTGWLVPADAPAASFAAAIRSAIAEPELRAEKARALGSLIARRHSFTHLKETVASCASHPPAPEPKAT